LSRTGEEFSVPGITVAVVAIPAMYILARAELRIAEQLESRALRADAIESLTYGYLSVVVAVGLLGDLAFKAWWVDGQPLLRLSGS
jgi:divalent metal cation (Fe/Co/Zn/Cd) transporter